jgi:hypothetical protein
MRAVSPLVAYADVHSKMQQHLRHSMWIFMLHPRDLPVSHVHGCANHREQYAKWQKHSDEFGRGGARQGQASGRQQAVHGHSPRAGGIKEPARGCVQPAEGGVPLHVQVGQQQQVLEVPAYIEGAHIASPSEQLNCECHPNRNRM